MKIANAVSVVGLGYVGLCTGAVFAERGFRTVGIDSDAGRISGILASEAPFHEPHLARLLKQVIGTRKLVPTGDMSEIVNTTTTFLAVGTPSKPDGAIDLSYIRKATQEIGRALRKKRAYHLVVVKSTVIPGTTTEVVKPILEETSEGVIGRELGLCVNPEFLREGSAIEDTLYPDKIIIGASDKKSSVHLKQLYAAFHRREMPPTILTTPETAEMIKYASNAFLATKVSYINTIANICQQIPGIDVLNVADAIGLDPRIGSLFLKAGPGYGGSCFHKDLQALIRFCDEKGYDPALFRATEEVNALQASRVVQLAKELLGTLREKKITILGLAFKKDTDDVRDASSLRVINLLLEEGAKVVACDPMAVKNARSVLAGSVVLVEDPYLAVEGADCCIIMTEWDQFRKLTPKDYLALMTTPNLVDARRLVDPDSFRQLNLRAIGLGSSLSRNNVET